MRFFVKLTLLSAFAAFLFACAPSGAQAAATPAPKPKLEVSGWIPYWRSATGTIDAMEHFDVLTEVNPFGYSVKSNGTIADTMKVHEEPWASFIAAARAKKIRVIPTLMWSNGADIHRILSNTETRINLEDSITALVNGEEYDGIEIDFEGKYAETRPYFSTFLRGLYQRMGKKWVMCDIEPRTPISSRYEGTPPKGAGEYANDYSAINKYCDRVKIMAYDQGSIDVKLNAANFGPYIPIADSTWVEKVVNLTAQTILKKKLVLGIPTYGYEYNVTSLSEDGYRYTLQWAFNPRYALDLAKEFNLTPVRNFAGELNITYFPAVPPPPDANPLDLPKALAQTTASDGTFNIAWWSDAKAIAEKVALARKLGLRGVAIFKIDGGGDPALWEALPRR
ncbi:hypothetical protein A3D66_00895 [Candidatus Kaiserbacteria bacterium RIFCSPHIGHO2_02_FULL_50_9]|nr:MAG: hypothetical protein A2761_00880 [Candidatus Kaiserbacteria bacterium RIFCSPHIGHO2_01_FULL_51_33]OGG63480.1 MAG: hypothetical protein A3D66_00895 [Candidatus Kaiserbacteria bacterium RIFCSPHIGHO2_02_FULL_50_9]